MAFSIENNPHVKLTREQVDAINKSLSLGVSVNELAKEYNVNASTISRIKNKQSWRK